MGNYIQEVSSFHGRSYLTKKMQTANEIHAAVEFSSLVSRNSS